MVLTTSCHGLIRLFDGVLGINIGKNVDTPVENAADDYLICLDKVYSSASYITVNVSSPTPQVYVRCNLRLIEAFAGHVMSVKRTSRCTWQTGSVGD